MNYKRYILNFFRLDRSNLLKFSMGFLLNLVVILILSVLLLFIFYILIVITYKSLVLFLCLVFGAKIYLKISLLVLLIILLKLQSRRRYAKYLDAKISRYIRNQDKDGLNKYKMILMMLGIYISFSVFGLGVYRVSGNDLSISNKSDIINIFIWATYLIAPIVAIWVFSSWKEQHNKKIDSDFIMNDIYNIVFQTKFEIVHICGFTKDYLDKNLSERESLDNDFNQNIQKLCYVHDFSVQKLADLAFIIDDNTYNNKFREEIIALSTKINNINELVKIVRDKEIYNFSGEVKDKYKELLDVASVDITNHTRAFMVELKNFYRA